MPPWKMYIMQRRTLYNNGQACRVVNMLQSWVWGDQFYKVSKRKAILSPTLLWVASAQQLLFLLVWHCKRYFGSWVKGRDFKAICIDRINEHRSVTTLSDVMVNYTRTGLSVSTPPHPCRLAPAIPSYYRYQFVLIRTHLKSKHVKTRKVSFVFIPVFSVDVGEETPRTVCSGLVGSVPQEELQVW